MSKPIGVLIVDDNAAVRRALGDLVGGHPDIEVLGLAGDGWEGVQRARELCPDVALVDVRMPGAGGPETTRQLLKLSPPPRVVAMSASEDRSAIVEMLRAGAVGYLVKGGSLADIPEAIRRARRGESTLSPLAAGEVIEAVVERVENDAALEDQRGRSEERLRRVIDGGGIRAAYQPIRFLGDRRVAGVEALARFSAEPDRGPLHWFAEADSVGLGLELELAAIRAALAHGAGENPFAHGFLSINASPDTLLSGRLGEVLDEGVPLDRIVIEVTEHARIDDYEAFAEAIAPLRGSGARLAVDDVGAGYASLRHILSLEPDLIKLDISLTGEIEKDSRKRALAASLITFAHETDCSVVAEGIETEAELTALISLGSDYGQGYFLGRPGPLEAAEAGA